jgi:hypothetical protein
MLNVSIVIMTLFGMFFAGLLAMAAIDGSYLGVGIYLFLILIIIYQISHYFRELSKLGASK